jgi:hypothetical protein
MRRFGPGDALLAVVLCLLSWGVSAAPPRPILSVDSVADMRTVDGRKSPLLEVNGFHAGSLQGGGLFIWQDTDKAPDNCTVFAALGGGRWLRRLEYAVLDVTMCGAMWDGVHDDAPAFNAAFTAASTNGFSLSCPGGTGRIASTVAPKRFANVVLRCQGMEASKLSCAVQGKPCFLFQNPAGAAAIQAPQIYDLDIAASSAPYGPTTVIQYNSVAGGFRDDTATQSYMMRPVVQRVQISGGAIGIQCSKCFDGDFSLNALSRQTRHGFDLEGSDWTSIGGAGPNRILITGGVPIRLASHGTFGNGLRVVHNDILAPAAGTEAYIYSSARTSYLEKNFMEGATGGACEIKIDMGAAHAVVRDNHVTDRTVKNWLCVVPQLRQADFSSNQTTTHGQGPARFESRGSWKDLILGHAITHTGNWSEAGFPSMWTLPSFF